MTTTDLVDVQADQPQPLRDTLAGARCTVCEHDLDAHDAISLRFCQASQARALTRGCICRKTG
jgi:hypothetical protein